MIVERVLASLAALPADRVALRETGGWRPAQISAGGLVERVERTAAGLVAEGLRPGDRVLFAVRPSIDAIALILATIRAGGVVVAADPGMGDVVFAARMERIQPRWVMAESAALALTAWPWSRALARRLNVQLPPLARPLGAAPVRLVRVGPWIPGLPAPSSHTLSRHAASPLPATGDPDDPAFLVFTSGTTEQPKVVVHTGRSLSASLDALSTALALTPDDVPYARDMHIILPALLAGACAVLPRGAATPSRALREMESHRVTHAFGTPVELQALLEEAVRTGRTLPDSLRTILLGAAPVYPPFLARFREVVPASATVYCVYAMTEMLPVARVTLEEKLAFAEAHGEESAGDLVGTPFPAVGARIAEDGELVLRGPQLCARYLDQPPLDELRTGDLARLDNQGRIVLLGRKKDMIIRRSLNVYPALYEPVISAIPGVRRCALVGLYDQTRADELIVLAVEGEEGQEPATLERRVAAELRSGPHRIDADALPDVILVTPLPLSGRSQKVDKAALRELAQRHLAVAA